MDQEAISRRFVMLRPDISSVFYHIGDSLITMMTITLLMLTMMMMRHYVITKIARTGAVECASHAAAV